jgi:Na+/proline symporter
MFWYSWALILSSQMSFTPSAFFRGTGQSLKEVVKYFMLGEEASAASSDQPAGEAPKEKVREVSFSVLAPSAFISWIFAKSIYNASSLGGKYGMIGCYGYTGWYLSFFAAAFVGYKLRTGPFSFGSLPQAVEFCYGHASVVLFMLMLFYRLFNEVWSNAIVVASFYGEYQTNSWWTAVAMSVVVPGLYVTMGGMKSSLMSDVIQACLFVGFLLFILGAISAETPEGVDFFNYGTDWTLEGGLDLWFAAIIQGLLSYAFFDPVLTDRTFLATPGTMVRSFLAGGLTAGAFIIFFGMLGVLGKIKGVGGDPVAVADTISPGFRLVVCIVMMTSSLSTLDSTFSSTSKLVGLELAGFIPYFRTSHPEAGPLHPSDPDIADKHVMLGRVAIALMCLIGTLPLISTNNALSATTVSGTMVMGLAPSIYLMCFWKKSWRPAPLAFLLPLIAGFVLGGLYSTKVCMDPPECLVKKNWYVVNGPGWVIGKGSYGPLLGVNLYGHLLCFLCSIVGFAINQCIWKVGEADRAPPDEKAKYSSPAAGAPPAGELELGGGTGENGENGENGGQGLL